MSAVISLRIVLWVIGFSNFDRSLRREDFVLQNWLHGATVFCSQLSLGLGEGLPVSDFEPNNIPFGEVALLSQLDGCPTDDGIAPAWNH